MMAPDYIPSSKRNPPYSNLQAPARRGPLVTLARIWETVPVPAGWDEEELPEPHQTCIGLLQRILIKDDWVVVDYDGDRWAEYLIQLLTDEAALNRLSVPELRDFITFLYRNEVWHQGGDFNGWAATGQLQRVLLRLAKLVSPEDFTDF